MKLNAITNRSIFNDPFKGVILYLNRIDYNNKKPSDVFIEVKRQPDMDGAGHKAKITLHRRYSILAACLALGLLSFPPGIQS